MRDRRAEVRQVAFKLDYSGGWGLYRRQLWRTHKNACARYDGPALAWFVTGCRAPDGSYWAIQSWQRLLPNYGLAPNRAQAAWELRLSHWQGDLPPARDQARLGVPALRPPLRDVRVPRPSDLRLPRHADPEAARHHARNLYLDTFNSAYGPGWKRENGFLTQNPAGTSATASTRTGTGRAARASATAPRSSGRASRPT